MIVALRALRLDAEEQTGHSGGDWHHVELAFFRLLRSRDRLAQVREDEQHVAIVAVRRLALG